MHVYTITIPDLLNKVKSCIGDWDVQPTSTSLHITTEMQQPETDYSYNDSNTNTMSCVEPYPLNPTSKLFDHELDINLLNLTNNKTYILQYLNQLTCNNFIICPVIN